MHQPVLLDSVLSYLRLNPGDIVLDGTVGSGGHAEAILRAIGATGSFIGLDRDEEALRRARDRLKDFTCRIILRHLNFRHLDRILFELNLKHVDAVLLDVGVSSEQLEDPDRGFSFQLNGPLDMRMDRSGGRTVQDLVERAGERDLIQIFREFGEERFAARIAGAIVRSRPRHPIQTTGELRKLVEDVTPIRFRYGRTHPATRIFQALRIAVNDELAALEESLPKAFDALKPGGRLAVITFHSLEDRIVKQFFVGQKKEEKGRILTKKPVRASSLEVQNNPSARSAKLRALERG